MISDECRLCGKTAVPKIKLSDKIKGFVSFKEFVEFFCRIELDEEGDEKTLPSSACQECYSVLLNFCVFTVNVEKQQNLFKNRVQKTEIPTSSNQIAVTKKTNEDESSSNGSSINNSSSSLENSVSSNKRRRSDLGDNIADCLRETAALFKDDLKKNEKNYEKITIKESLLKDFGEIPKSWLEHYRGYTTWKELSYKCFHCNKDIQSLNGLLKHFDEHKITTNKRVITCSCGKSHTKSAYLISHLNHVTNVHHNHLKFTCIFCSKVFVNTVKLSNHIENCHGNKKVKIYQCYHCGLSCISLDRLKNHKKLHEN